MPWAPVPTIPRVRRAWPLLAALLSLALLGAACSGNSEPDAAAAPSPTVTARATPSPTPTAAPTEAAARPTPASAASAVLVPGVGARASVSPQRLVAAIEETSSFATYSFEVSGSVTGLAGSAPVPLAASGAVNAAAGRFAMSLDMSAMLDAIDTRGMTAQDIARLRAGFDSPMDMVVGGGTVYLRWPPFSELLEAPTEWVAISADAYASGEAVGQAGSVSTPDEFFPMLRQAADLQSAGSETVRGVETSRWDGEINWAAFVRTQIEQQLASGALDSETADYLLALLEQGALSDDPVPVSVWIDKDGLMRRYTVEFRYPDALSRALGGDVSMSVAYELFDFGAPVDIALPDPADVTDVSAMLDGGSFGP